MRTSPKTPSPGGEEPPFFEFAPRPVPEEALERLRQAALGASGGSQAARAILFWLAGEPDPSGYLTSGGLELRRLDAGNRQAALDVINWWAFPENSERLDAVLEDLSRHFRGNNQLADPASSFLPPLPLAEKERRDGTS